MKLLISLITLFLISASFPQEIKEKENSLLTYAQTKMSINNYVDMMRALEIGERYFHIEQEMILVLLFIESDFNVHAKGENEDSTDYGLSQQNSKYINERYFVVKKILDKEKIACNLNDNYDIYLNVLSAYYYLDFCFKLKGSKTGGIKKYNGSGKQTEAYLNKFLGVYYG